MHHLSEHDNVVRITGTYEDSVFVHIVMELCAGEVFFLISREGRKKMKGENGEALLPY
ncbi:hypothetical protein RND81_07G144600 [Saponaria officinalis]|uniref:Protein kinase domain-containing protein n=1 Tax=Saponaria officinalis TaxID=3572 RepID=A0AAW1JSH1_SAPOF